MSIVAAGSGIRYKPPPCSGLNRDLEHSVLSRRASVSYRCHTNGAKTRKKANKKEKEKENLTIPI
jgi:hypothetical protein